MFSNPPEKRPEEYPKEFNLIPPEDPLESITFKMLNKRVPRFMQSNSQSFHARFYGPGKVPSKTSSRFHPRENEDVDICLPWRMSLDDIVSMESAGEAS